MESMTSESTIVPRMTVSADLRRPDDPARSCQLRSGLLALRPRLAAGLPFVGAPRKAEGCPAQSKSRTKRLRMRDGAGFGQKTKRERQGRSRSYYTSRDSLVATTSRTAAAEVIPQHQAKPRIGAPSQAERDINTRADGDVVVQHQAQAELRQAVAIGRRA